MRWELGAVCIMSPIKRDQSRRGAADFLYSLQMIQTPPPLHTKRAAGDVGRTGSLLARHVLLHICGLVRSQRYCICPGAEHAAPPAPPPPPPSFQLKHQIMNSLFQQEAIRTECPFKFELITNNLHVHSREL